MINTEALRVYIQSELLKIFPHAGYERLPDDTEFPYLSWNISWVSTTGSQATGVLEINGWDKTTDPVELEKLCDGLCERFNSLTHIQNEFHVTISFLRRQPVEDDNPDIRRRRMQFQIRYTGGY